MNNDNNATKLDPNNINASSRNCISIYNLYTSASDLQDYAYNYPDAGSMLITGTPGSQKATARFRLRNSPIKGNKVSGGVADLRKYFDHIEIRWLYRPYVTITNADGTIGKYLNANNYYYEDSSISTLDGNTISVPEHAVPEDCGKLTLYAKYVSKQDDNGNYYYPDDWLICGGIYLIPIPDPPSGVDIAYNSDNKTVTIAAQLDTPYIAGSKIEFTVSRSSNENATWETHSTINPLAPSEIGSVSTSLSLPLGYSYRVQARTVLDVADLIASKTFVSDTDSTFINKNKANIKSPKSSWTSWSSPIQTPPDTPPTNFTNSLIKNADVYNIQYTWNYDSGLIGNITNFEIGYVNDTNPTQAAARIKDDTQISTITTEGKQLNASLFNVSPGQYYYAKVRAINSAGHSRWSDIINLVVGSEPGVPTTWSSVTSLKMGEKFYLYWQHNPTDSSRSTGAIIHISDGTNSMNVNVNYLPFQDEKTDFVYSLLFKTTRVGDSQHPAVEVIKQTTSSGQEVWDPSHTVSGNPTYSGTKILNLGDGKELTWSIQTYGMNSSYVSPRSTNRSVYVFTPPTLIMDVYDGLDNNMGEDEYDSIFSSLPLKIKLQANPDEDIQYPVNVLLNIKALMDYSVLDIKGDNKNILSGDIIYSKIIEMGRNNNHVEHQISAGDINFKNGIPYIIEATLSSSVGLTSEVSKSFIVNFDEGNNLIISADLFYYHDDYSMAIRPKIGTMFTYDSNYMVANTEREEGEQYYPDDWTSSDNKIFKEQPTVPYKIGDIWLSQNGTSYTGKKCISANNVPSTPYLVDTIWVSNIEPIEGYRKALTNKAQTELYSDDDWIYYSNKVFKQQPTTPYEINDIWLIENSGSYSCKKCIESRTSEESYISTDWETYTPTNVIVTGEQTYSSSDWENIENNIIVVEQIPEVPYSKDDIWIDTINLNIYKKAVKGETDEYVTDDWETYVNQVLMLPFSQTPTPPYNINDLWIQDTGTSKIYYKCVTSKTRYQEYSSSDWTLLDNDVNVTIMTSTPEPPYSVGDIFVNSYYSQITEMMLVDTLCSIYRLNYDGNYEPIAINMSSLDNTWVIDNYPPLKYVNYRIVSINRNTGVVTYADSGNYSIMEPSVIVQWDNQNYSGYSYDPFDDEEKESSAGLLLLPYNIDVSESNSVDSELVEYFGRSYPVGYYGTQIGETLTIKTDIDKRDYDTLYKLRMLSTYKGNAYVREPSGNGYLANVTVNYDINHVDTIIPITIKCRRVDD